jgi:hypothetical protein
MDFGSMDPNLKDDDRGIVHASRGHMRSPICTGRALVHTRRNSMSLQHLEASLAVTSPASIHVDLDAQVTATIERIDDIEVVTATHLGALASASTAFESWWPLVEASIDEICTSLNLLRDEVSKWVALATQALLLQFDSAARILYPYQLIPKQSPTIAYNDDDPHGHFFDNSRRGHGFGHPHTQHHLPTNGMPNFMFHPPPPLRDPMHQYNGPRPPDVGLESKLGKLPRLNFPSFDGKNPNFGRNIVKIILPCLG